MECLADRLEEAASDTQSIEQLLGDLEFGGDETNDEVIETISELDAL